jgi:hypothetical protein
MEVPNRTKFFILLGLVFLNLLVRFPQDDQFREHEIDTFSLHPAAESIVNNNEANWVANPLSVFGIFPYSYPSLPILLVAAISFFTGLSIENSIFALAQVVGLLAIGAGYLLGGEIRDNFSYRVFMAAFVSLAPNFVFETTWSIPKRGIFLLEFILLLWLLLRFRHTNHDKRYLLLMIPVLFAMAATHRMFLLIPLVFLAYAGTLLLLFLWSRIHFVLEHNKRELSKWTLLIIWASGIVGLLYLQASRSGPFSNAEHWHYYKSGFFFDGTSARIIFLNAVVDYWSSVGFFSVLGIIGLYTFVKRPVHDVILLNMLLIGGFSVGLMLGTYMVVIFIPLFGVLAAEGFFQFFKLLPRLRRARFPILVTTIIITSGFSSFMVQHWIHKPVSPGMAQIPSEDTYSAALFIKHQLPAGNAISNDPLIARRLSAYGHFFCAPTVYDIQYAVFGLIDPGEVDVSIRNPSSFTPDTNTFFRKEEPPEQPIIHLPYTFKGTPKGLETLERFSIYYAIMTNDNPTEVRYTRRRGVSLESPLFVSVYNKKITLYRNDKLTVSTILGATEVQ